MFKSMVILAVIALLAVQFVEIESVPRSNDEGNLSEQYNRVCGEKWWIIVTPEQDKTTKSADDSKLADNNPFKEAADAIKVPLSEKNPFRKTSDKAEGAFVAVRDTCRIPITVALKLFKSFTPEIKSLEIDCGGLNKTDLETIAKFVYNVGQKSLVKLKFINLESFGILSDLSMFGTPKKIEHLDLQDCKIDANIKLSSIVPNLISMELNNVDVNVQSLTDLSKLKILELISMPQIFFKYQKPIVAFNNVKLFRISVDKPIDIETGLPFSLDNVELISIESTDMNSVDENKDLVEALCDSKQKLEKLIFNIPDSFMMDELQEIANEKPQLKEIRGVVQDKATTTDELLAFYTKFDKINLIFKQ